MTVKPPPSLRSVLDKTLLYSVPCNLGVSTVTACPCATRSAEASAAVTPAPPIWMLGAYPPTICNTLIDTTASHLKSQWVPAQALAQRPVGSHPKPSETPADLHLLSG